MIEAARRAGDLELVDEALGWFAGTLVAVKRFDDGLRVLDEIISSYERRDRRAELALHLANKAYTLLERGRPGDRRSAHDLAVRALGLATELSLPIADEIRAVVARAARV